MEHQDESESTGEIFEKEKKLKHLIEKVVKTNYKEFEEK